MTLLKHRLTQAGAATAEARLMALAIESLRDADGELTGATDILWNKLRAEPWVAKDIWLRAYVKDRQADMRGPAVARPTEHQSNTQSIATRSSNAVVERRKAPVEALIKKAVKAIEFSYLTSDGRDWARVGAHELAGMERDGRLAMAIQAKLGSLSNSQRFMSLGQLISSREFNDVRASLAALNKDRGAGTLFENHDEQVRG